MYILTQSKEGAFLRAYEQSAWLMSRHAAAELTPKRHKTKQTADGTFVFVGFPMTSLDKYRPEHSQDIPYDETHFILDLPADTFPEEVTKELYDADFERWKKEIPLTDNKSGKPEKAQPDSQKDTDCKHFSIPAFNGYAQILVQASNEPGHVIIECSSEGCKSAEIIVNSDK